MKIVGLAFLATFTYKFALNLSALLRINYYKKRYDAYRKEEAGSFDQYTKPIIQLFQSAEINDIKISSVIQHDENRFSTAQGSLFFNIGHRSPEVIGGMLHCFAIAKGTYRNRLIECFSPLYWINLIVFLPSKLFSYLGLNKNAIPTKVAQLFYWLFVPLLIAFRTDIYQYVLRLLTNAQ